MNTVVLLFAAILGTLGFALLFGLEKRLLGFAAFGGALTWGIYLAAVCLPWNGVFIPCFIAAVAAAGYSQISAYFLKIPTVVLLAPSVLPIVPGADLYYTFLFLYRKEWNLFLSRGKDTLLSVFAISMGMTLVYFIKTVYYRIKKVE